MDFVSRIGKTNVSGKIEDLYFELNKWSFESEFNCFISSELHVGIVGIMS